ncbi:MAG TPA: polysaccharide deacetylase family protein [Longimicrobiales bacterium]|nr:polysaccharide deacetylase family protein [Longimicrobiales bacterium]
MRDRLRRLPHEEAERLVELACRGAGGHADAASRGAAVLDWDELRELGRQGVAFGAHTRHHVSLTSVSEERVRTEIRESLGDLERELGRVSRTLAYPYGLCNEVVARIAREEGSALAFTCQDGLNESGRTDPFWLRRTNITTRTSAPVFKVRMLPWFATVDRWRHRRSPSLPS